MHNSYFAVDILVFYTKLGPDKHHGCWSFFGFALAFRVVLMLIVSWLLCPEISSPLRSLYTAAQGIAALTAPAL